MIATRELELKPAEAELPELGRSEYARTCLAAAMLLERDGWCQGSIQNATGARCVGGAFIEVLEPSYLRAGWRITDEINSQERKAFEQIWQRFAGPGRGTGWNDAPERTQAEVIEVLLEEAWLADSELE